LHLGSKTKEVKKTYLQARREVHEDEDKELETDDNEERNAVVVRRGRFRGRPTFWLERDDVLLRRIASTTKVQFQSFRYVISPLASCVKPAEGKYHRVYQNFLMFALGVSNQANAYHSIMSRARLSV
jgi:hypothetical protein